ncbi:trypsin-like peptidase domain-containing protein [Usitatibacter palustris]|uniref:J domain-containing protein n=1 Tax=Usitatibacter palustris TaxID=2732487 RepID=A0A6M4H3D2_9PROT|nr:trypsin-like peptidase domain-containing protein [Usitatibacter palustris]QJR13812.1 hypothetical protein DSM104440_00602 [Usitatibacter palustris]
MAARTPTKKRSLYDILGVPRDAMAIDIGVAYKKRLAALDKQPDADPNEIALVREAYHILCQPRERESYDASLVTREERAEAMTRPAPDLVLESEDDEQDRKRRPLIWIGVGAVALLLVGLIAWRQATTPKNVAVKEAPPAEPETPKPPPPPPPKERNAKEILALASPSVARIVAYEVSGTAVPMGSGIMVAPDAIVTTCHGLPAGGQIVARIGAESLPATLVVTDEDLNLCRLSVPRMEVAGLAASAEEPKAGDKVFAVGQHQGTDLSVIEGTIKELKAGRVLEISMPVAASASGGALFDAYGRLVGVLTSRQRGATNAALPATAIAQMRTRGTPAPKAP